MPIKNLKPVLAEAGKIKIGGLGPKVTSRTSGKEFRPPVKYDEFVITTTHRDPNGDLIPDENLMRVLKKGKAEAKLRQIPILLHSDDIEEVFPSCYASYKGQQLFCRGDGEKATRWDITRDGKRTGKTNEIKCPCELLESKACKPHATLNCMIRADQRAVAGAVHKWRTTSWNSIRRTLASLHQIKGLFGTLRNIPLRLKMIKIRVTPKDQPPRTVICAYVECAAEDFGAIQQQALAGARMYAETRALSAGNDAPEGYSDVIDIPGVNETPAEQARVTQEFHPAASYDPLTGEVLIDTSPAPENDPPDPEPEPDGEESPFSPEDAGEHTGKPPPVPRDDPARQVVIDLIGTVAAIKIVLAESAPDDEDWDDKLKAAKLDIWNAVCHHALGLVPEGEPEVTQPQLDAMRMYLKRQQRNGLMAQLVTNELQASTKLKNGSKNWEKRFTEARHEHWTTLCQDVIGVPMSWEQALAEDLLDRLIEALHGALETARGPTNPGDDDGGQKEGQEKPEPTP